MDWIIEGFVGRFVERFTEFERFINEFEEWKLFSIVLEVSDGFEKLFEEFKGCSREVKGITFSNKNFEVWIWWCDEIVEKEGGVGIEEEFKEVEVEEEELREGGGGIEEEECEVVEKE